MLTTPTRWSTVARGVLTYDEQIIAGATLDQFSVLLGQLANIQEEAAESAKGPGAELYWEGFVDGIREAARFAKDVVK